MLEFQHNFHTLAEREAAHDWLAALPNLLDMLCDKWQLQLADPFTESTVSIAFAALRNGQRVVLKIQWPHPECEFEADALRIWDGNGAIRLLEHDAENSAMLLEECLPGTHLSKSPDVDQIGVMIDLLPRLWTSTCAPFKSLKRECMDWSTGMVSNWLDAGKPCERRLVDAALDYIEILADTQSEQVLIHQDLHGDNVLASQRDRWLAIDPKPLVGEREFGLSPVIRSFEFGECKQQVLGRLDRLTQELGLDRERSRGWTVAQTIAWSFTSCFAEQHYQTVRWLLDDQ
ncbi:MAG: aminoglycoside phosphotransferase [Granulosicoccus sp.]|nr:aminoglycoside phosphotransferase [Granulosicoccus sp.]